MCNTKSLSINYRVYHGWVCTAKEDKHIDIHNQALQPLCGCETALEVNPDRGFRLEVALDVRRNTNPFKPAYTGTEWLEHQLSMYANENPRLVQLYFYLSDYGNRKLDETAFLHMRLMMEALRKHQLRALLRFAYETDFGGPKGARTDRILGHLQQLRPFLQEFQDRLFVVQVGLVGAWGEWHSEKHPQDRKALLEGLLDTVPVEVPLQARLPRYKALIGADHPQAGRIGLHDDFIVCVPHEWDGGLHPGTEDYRAMTEQSADCVVDGELPWGSWSVLPEGFRVDGAETAKRLALHHYSSLSLIHNYREDGPDKPYSMCDWKQLAVTPESLKEFGLQARAGWFLDDRGQPMVRSMFSFIRDHLGYALGLQACTVKANQLEMVFLNEGFARPYGIRVALVRNSQKDAVGFETLATCDLQEAHPGQPLCWLPELAADRLTGHIGLRLTNPAGEPVRMTTGTDWSDGIHWIGMGG